MPCRGGELRSRQVALRFVIIDEAKPERRDGTRALYLGHNVVWSATMNRSVRRDRQEAVVIQNLIDQFCAEFLMPICTTQTSVYDLARQSFGETVGW